MKHRLFLSFTGLVRRMAEGETVPADFDGALFYFGCKREHAMRPWEPSLGNQVINELLAAFRRKGSDDMADAHRALIAALEKGEREGRVAWREGLEVMSFDRLNQLLASNGLPILDPFEHLPTHLGGAYSYPSVRRMAEIAEAPIEVIY